jgi:spermidine synthase
VQTRVRHPFGLILLLLFAGSGCAALVFEVVWFHLLRLYVGSSAVSLGLLLGTFMGGMCLGSLLLPRLLPARWHPLAVYAGLELGIGLAGLAMPAVLPVLGRFYIASVGHGTPGILLRGVVCAAALLPPTMLMGATLPAISRWLGSDRAGLGALGRFYGANIAGAVLGTLGTGFWLLRVHDARVASQVAAAINGAVAAVALLLATSRAEAAPVAAAAEVAAPRRRAVHLAIALSGATALGAEVVWTRLLSLLFGASVYTFSLILAVFLLGLGLGSAAGARIAARSPTPRRALAWCQFLLAPALLYRAWMIGSIVPYCEPSYVLQEFAHRNMLVRFPWDFARCALAILPGPLLWGASFPLALAAAGDGGDAGRLVGGVYAANTIGAIAGALAASLLVVVFGGSQHTEQLLVLVAGGTATMLVSTAPTWRPAARLAVSILVASAALGIAAVVPAVPPGLIAHGRDIKSWNDGVEYLEVVEGINSSVAITWSRECLNFHVSGKIEASTDYTDMRLQRMLGHLPALAHGAPKKVLIVGCGAGVTAGAFAVHDSVERIVICELEPAVIKLAREWMADANGGILDDPRTEIVFDDARHFLATTKEKFDVITSDPIHPWVRGAAALYTLDYHELVKQHLAPGGVVTQWVPLYQTDMASVKSQIGTFCRAFPHATVWSSDSTGKGYDLALMAADGPLAIDVDAVQDRFDREAPLRAALQPYGLGGAVELFSTYAGRAEDLRPWLADAQLNDDLGLRLQYLAGMAIDLTEETTIFAAIVQHRRFPADVLVASPALTAQLRQAVAR